MQPSPEACIAPNGLFAKGPQRLFRHYSRENASSERKVVLKDEIQAEFSSHETVRVVTAPGFSPPMCYNSRVEGL